MSQGVYFKQLLDSEKSDRKIARVIGCRRELVKKLRGCNEIEIQNILRAKNSGPIHAPEWSALVNWENVVGLIKKGFEIKRIWEDTCAEHTTYSNFWKYIQKNLKPLLKGTITLRSFGPGSQCEVDWAGDKIPWINIHREKHESHVFVGVLCFSQILFARATSDEKQANFIDAHERFFIKMGGVPAVTVSDNLKTGVKIPDRYDAELNPVYQDFAKHYGTTIVPARVYKPKDKSIVEGAVGIIMRYFRWVHRNHNFSSLADINLALETVCSHINERKHTRFNTSRLQRFLELEKPALRRLPEQCFEQVEWKTATLHLDNTLEVYRAFYSAPHALRGKKLRVKLTKNTVEIFYDLNRVALHRRDRNQRGNRIIDLSHLPSNSRAYLENTPQSILSQARFINAELFGLIDELFKVDTLANLRRALGLVRYARVELETCGRHDAELRIKEAILQMTRFDKIRVRFFRETIDRLRIAHQLDQTKINRDITRAPGNPMLRQTALEPVQESQFGVLIQLPERERKE
jgi:hypothetical protein